MANCNRQENFDKQMSCNRYTNRFVKSNVEFTEYAIHKIVYNLGIIKVPKIFHYDKQEKKMTMQKVNNDCLSNIYGENAEDIPPQIFSQVRDIITKLHYHHIEYPDITGYNFMEDFNGKVWIIDFGHAKCRDIENPIEDPFIINFINGLNAWNPEFR